MDLLPAGTHLLLDLDLLVVFAGTWLLVSAQTAEGGGGAASRAGAAGLLAEAVEVLQIGLLVKDVTTTCANILPLVLQHLQRIESTDGREEEGSGGGGQLPAYLGSTGANDSTSDGEEAAHIPRPGDHLPGHLRTQRQA